MENRFQGLFWLVLVFLILSALQLCLNDTRILLILSKISGKLICKKLAAVCDGVSDGCSSERAKNERRADEETNAEDRRAIMETAPPFRLPETLASSRLPQCKLT